MSRILVISDPTLEFPNNTNMSFKVCLEDRINLPKGEEWEAALISLSVPNQHFGMESFGLTQYDVLVKFSIRVEDVDGNQSSLSKELVAHEIFGGPPITTGMELWRRISEKIATEIEHMLQVQTTQWNRKEVRTYVDRSFEIKVDVAQGTVEVDFNDQDHNNVGVSFELDLEFCLKMGLLEMNARGDYYLTGASPRTQLQTATGGRQYNESRITEIHSGNRSYWGLNNHAYPIGPRRPRVVFSRTCNWHFSGQNAAFLKNTTTKSRSLHVYCSLAQSTFMGSQKAQLLREVFLKHDEYDHRQLVEPLHYQWIPMSSKEVEIIEVEIADLDGKIATLPQGKTIATVAIRGAGG